MIPCHREMLDKELHVFMGMCGNLCADFLNSKIWECSQTEWNTFTEQKEAKKYLYNNIYKPHNRKATSTQIARKSVLHVKLHLSFLVPRWQKWNTKQA